jgi:CheY-like chemotaxis protein
MTNSVRQPLILVADDDKEFREELIPTALGRINARIVSAADVDEACSIAEEHGPESKDPLELVVLDMHMPLDEEAIETVEDGGIQFLQRIIAMQRRVVVFTAYASFRNCALAIRAGASAYLPKMEQELYEGGVEGGVDDLVETCKRLL